MNVRADQIPGLLFENSPSKPGNKFDSALAAHVPAMLEAKSDVSRNDPVIVVIRS